MRKSEGVKTGALSDLVLNDGGRVVSAEPVPQAQNVFFIAVQYPSILKHCVFKRGHPLSTKRANEIRKESCILRACEDLALPVPRLIAEGHGQYLVTAFVEGRRLSEILCAPMRRAQRQIILRQLGETTGRFHRYLTSHPIAKSAHVSRFTSQELIEQQSSNLQYLESIGAAGNMPDIGIAIDILKGALPLSESRVFCHGDLSDVNIICDRIGQVVLLDWADAAVMPGPLDLASLTSKGERLCTSEIDIRSVISGYEDMTGHRVKHFGFYRALDEVTRCINLLSQGLSSDFTIKSLQTHLCQWL